MQERPAGLLLPFCNSTREMGYGSEHGMNSDPNPEYSDKDVTRILRRAAELQEQAGSPARSGQGASREDLKRIGGEVGIDPAFIEAALAEGLDAGVAADHQGQSRWLGAPPQYAIERVIPGQLTPESWGTLVGMLNHHFKQSKAGKVSGGFHSWKYKHDLGSVYVSAIQTEAGVRLKLELDIDSAIVAGLVPTVTGWFGATSILFSNDSLRPWLSTVFSAVALVGLATAFRTCVRSWWVKDRRRNAALFDQLASAVSSSPVSALEAATPVLAEEGTVDSTESLSTS